jgi:hypothetical protein
VTYGTVDGIKCAYFDGSSRLSSSDLSLLPIGAQVRTLSVWIRPSSVSSDTYALAYGESSSNKYFGLNLDHSSLYFAANNNSNPVTYTCATDTWIHVAGVYDGSTLKLYINGVLHGEAAFPTATLNTGSQSIDIGGRYTGDLYFKGYMASARIYNRVLTDSEIAELAKEFNV